MGWVGSVWDAVYGWFASLTAEGWAALGTWAAVMVALATVVVAGVYAAKQVSEAQTVRREQSQPNVVMFTEPNPVHWQFLELVVKNFGATPAYNITMKFDPTPQVSPSGGRDEVTDLWLPKVIPILAPGQEWRTWWDYAVARKKATGLASRHQATVCYEDGQHEKLETNAVLDWDSLKDTNKVTVKGSHQIAELLDKQNDLLKSIGESVARFGRQTDGVWVFTADAATEADRRAANHAESHREAQELHDGLFPSAQSDNAETPTPSDADGTGPRSTPQEPVSESGAP